MSLIVKLILLIFKLQEELLTHEANAALNFHCVDLLLLYKPPSPFKQNLIIILL